MNIKRESPSPIPVEFPYYPDEIEILSANNRGYRDAFKRYWSLPNVPSNTRMFVSDVGAGLTIAIDSADFKPVLTQFVYSVASATGVTVINIFNDDTLVYAMSMAANNSVPFNPPIIFSRGLRITTQPHGAGSIQRLFLNLWWYPLRLL